MLILLSLLGCSTPPVDSPKISPPADTPEVAPAEAEDGEQPPGSDDAGPRPGVGEPGSGGIPTHAIEAPGEADSPSEVLPSPTLSPDPPEAAWWGPPVELVLDTTSAGEQLIGEWQQVWEPSQEHHVRLLTLLSQEPALTAEQRAAEALDPADVAYIESVQALLIEKPGMQELLEKELTYHQHRFLFTMAAKSMTINTRKAALTTDYTVKSVYSNQAAIIRQRADGEEVTTLVTFVDSDRIRVRPNADDSMVLRFSRQ